MSKLFDALDEHGFFDSDFDIALNVEDNLDLFDDIEELGEE